MRSRSPGRRLKLLLLSEDGGKEERMRGGGKGRKGEREKREERRTGRGSRGEGKEDWERMEGKREIEKLNDRVKYIEELSLRSTEMGDGKDPFLLDCLQTILLQDVHPPHPPHPPVYVFYILYIFYVHMSYGFCTGRSMTYITMCMSVYVYVCVCMYVPMRTCICR